MLYKVLRVIGGFFLRIIFRIEVIGKENIPEDGSLIICPNHLSNWDPFMLSISLPRQIHWMGKAELFENKLLAYLLDKLGVFAVRRGETDITAIKTSFRILQEGKVLGIFPEGTRVSEEEIAAAKEGAALISIRSKSPIVPVHIESNYKIFRKVKLTIGEPLRYYEEIEGRPTKEDYRLVSDNLLDTIYNL